MSDLSRKNVVGKFFPKRSLTTLLLVLLFVLVWVYPVAAMSSQEAQQRFQAWRTAPIENLARLPQIPIKNYPPIRNDGRAQRNLRAVNAFSTFFDRENGEEWLSPLTYFVVGNFDLLGFSSMSIADIGQKTGVNTGSLPAKDFAGILDLITPRDLLSMPSMAGIANRPVSEIPALDGLMRKKLQSRPVTLDDVGGGGSVSSNLTVEAAVGTIPEFADSPITDQADPETLEKPLDQALPGLNKTPLSEVRGSSELPLAALDAAKVGDLSLSQMPIPLELVPGVRIGRVDVALGTPRQGDREQNRIRIVSGGIPKDDFILVGGACTGNSCPHFEISSEMGGAIAGHGAAWMDATGQEVSDGFGPLCLPWNCKGPPGNHPFGPALRVIFKNIDQTKGSAEVAISFPYCKSIFGKKTCTPWVFPVADGLPVAEIREEALIAYLMPGEKVPGEITYNPFPNPRENPDPPVSPSGPVPPPQPCPPGENCVMLNPLPRMSAAGIYSRFRRRRPRHNGVDIQTVNAAARGAAGAVTTNENVVAPADGVVTFTCDIGTCGGYGYAVEIHHPQLGIYTFSGHLYRRLVNRGDRVTRGQVIGIEGGSGGSGQRDYALHDHFEVRTTSGRGAVKVDPEGYRFTNPTMIPPRPTDRFD